MNTMKLAGAVSLLCVLYLPVSVFSRTQQNISLTSFEAVKIPIDDGDTDFTVEFDESICPSDRKCQISLDIQQMNCSTDSVDDDPHYIKFTPLKTVGPQGIFETLCVQYGPEKLNTLRPLKAFDLTSVLIQPVGLGGKWENGVANVELFARITQTKQPAYILDSAVQDIELEIDDSSVQYEIRTELCVGGDNCDFPHSIFTQLKSMQCSGSEDGLRLTTYNSKNVEIESTHVCKRSFVPMDVLGFRKDVTRVQITPLGDWNTNNVSVILTSSVHVFRESGRSCPDDYFDCGKCTGSVLWNDTEGVSSCIPNKFLCNTRPHCGLPCYADEFDATCDRVRTSSAEDSNCSGNEKYTNDLNDLYVFMLQVFLYSSCFTVIMVISIACLMYFKLDDFLKRMRKSLLPERYVAVPPACTNNVISQHTTKS